MVRGDEFSPFFQKLLESPAAAIAVLRRDAFDFEAEIVDMEAGTHKADTILPLRSVFAFAVFDNYGNRIPAEAPDWMPAFATLDNLQLYATNRRGERGLLSVDRDEGPPVFGIWAPWAEAREWNLPHYLRSLTESNRVAVVALFASGSTPMLEEVASTFGLTPLQRRLVFAVIQTGSVKEAAQFLGITYATARETMSAAARRTGSANTPALIRKVVSAAFGILPSEPSSSTDFTAAFSITERQARIALLIAEGYSREATARELGTSVAVIKKELQSLYPALGVSTAADLARLITEIQALQLFARTTDNAPGFQDTAIEPSRFTSRPGGGLIAWSDYGPASGHPVLVVHSNWCCRPVPYPLVRELQRNGWRPIAIDRPGFGATDLGKACREDPFSQAIEDAAQILDELKITRVSIVAHCGAQFVHAFASRLPQRLGAVVLVCPTPQASAEGRREGPVGVFKEAFFRSPRLVELFFRVISSQMSFRRVERLMRWITQGSAVDQALCDDPQFIRDRFRALRPFACGGYAGGIIEEMVISHGGWEFVPIALPNWVILQGEQDYHNHQGEVTAYWSRILPRARMEIVPGAGRFMTSSHPEIVVRWLNSAAQGQAAG